jgi:hypothetical protein
MLSLQTKSISVVLLTLFLSNTFFITPAYADDAEEKISPIEKGQYAPFTGVLMSPGAVAKVIVEFNTKQAQIDLEVNRAVAEQQTKDQLQIDELNASIIEQKKIADAEKQSYNKQLSALNEQLSKVEKQKNLTPLYVAGGALVGAIVASLIAIGTMAVSK